MVDVSFIEIGGNSSIKVGYGVMSPCINVGADESWDELENVGFTLGDGMGFGDATARGAGIVNGEKNSFALTVGDVDLWGFEVTLCSLNIVGDLVVKTGDDSSTRVGTCVTVKKSELFVEGDVWLGERLVLGEWLVFNKASSSNNVGDSIMGERNSRNGKYSKSVGEMIFVGLTDGLSEKDWLLANMLVSLL
jgi:hypothetical protein